MLEFFQFLMSLHQFFGFLSVNLEYNLQNTFTYIIDYNSNWNSYENLVDFINNNINLYNCFDKLTFINTAFATNNK